MEANCVIGRMDILSQQTALLNFLTAAEPLLPLHYGNKTLIKSTAIWLNHKVLLKKSLNVIYLLGVCVHVIIKHSKHFIATQAHARVE